MLSAGVMQIGWSTSRSLFGAGQGVGKDQSPTSFHLICPVLFPIFSFYTLVSSIGDTPDSFAYDGSRVRKWNVTAENYGEKWEEDDVIGCCIDLHEGFVEFFRLVD